MLQNFGGQGKVFGQFFEHLFVGTGRPGRRLLHHRQPEFGEENFANLLGAAQIKRLSRQRVGLGLEFQNAGAQGLTLRS